jgi:hypothetical protein
MKPLSRNLVFGMQDNDVRELQRNSVWLGFDILSQKVPGGRFGSGLRCKYFKSKTCSSPMLWWTKDG